MQTNDRNIRNMLRQCCTLRTLGLRSPQPATSATHPFRGVAAACCAGLPSNGVPFTPLWNVAGPSGGSAYGGSAERSIPPGMEKLKQASPNSTGM